MLKAKKTKVVKIKLEEKITWKNKNKTRTKNVDAEGNGVISRSRLLKEVLDKTNRIIVRKLQENPELSQTELAKAVSMSQSSIALRLQKIFGSGLIRDPININYKKLGLSMARIDVTAKDAHAVLDWARRCPLCVNGSRTLDRTNLSLYFVSEDLESLNWIIDSHLRKIDGITDISCQMITSWAWDDALHMRLDLDTEREDAPPCGITPFCPKCPRNPEYEGQVWAQESLHEFET